MNQTKKICCLVDKKAFLAAQRDAITATLDELQVDWTFKALDIKKYL